MNLIRRELREVAKRKLLPGKVLVVCGARRVGKTVLVKELIRELKSPYLYLNGEDIHTHDLLAKQSAAHYRKVLGRNKLLVIDEAQKIPEIGLKLKLMLEEIADIRILISASSVLDINPPTGEPLTSREFSFILYPLSEKEYQQVEHPLETPDKLRERLVYGNYPELVRMKTDAEKQEYLNERLSAYLLNDILVYENIKNAGKIFNLLRLIAFQIGEQVSYHELGKQLGISKNTVERYLELLAQVFILHKVEGFSRNLKKEITKSARWYFLDNGLLNAVISNFNALEARNDAGQLWENYMIAERLKVQEYKKMRSNNHFWKTYDQQEIDWVEERDGKLFGYDFKWSPKKFKTPPQWAKAYPEAYFEVVHPDNYFDFLDL